MLKGQLFMVLAGSRNLNKIGLRHIHYDQLVNWQLVLIYL